jgi:Kef-type K+ transport system membrane component KefB
MFAVGMQLDPGHLRHRAKTALFVSHVSIVFPFFLGVLLSLWLYPSLAAPGAPFTSFALFLGIATSITAFPVLARILDERGISKTSLGSTAISCAAVGDLTAWSILAFIVVLTRAGSILSIVIDLVLVIAFVAFMLLIVRRLLPRWFLAGENGEKLTKGTLAGVLMVVLASALTTEILGIHALFGAFLAGVIMPSRTAFRHALKLRLENFSSILLLPLFFAFTGLRTQIGLLQGASAWGICLLIIFVATLGKLGGGMVTARLTGVGWLDSFRLGALMNTRGLMELIALNLGYDLGILSTAIFTMLVIMALITTFLTGPLLNLANGIEHRGGLERVGSQTA